MKQHGLKLSGDDSPQRHEVIQALESRATGQDVGSPVALAGPVQWFKNPRVHDDRRELKSGELHNGVLQNGALHNRDLGCVRLSAEQKTEHGALFDPVTGLPSRHLFHDRVTQAVRVAQRSQTIFGIACLDLAHFEEVSDVYGPNGGDLLLQQVVERIRQGLCSIDTAARLDGDTFVLLLHDLLVKGMSARLTAILQDVSLPFTVQSKEVLFSGSAGLAVFPTDGTDYDVLLKHAEMAMHKSNTGGRNNLPRLGWPKA